MYCTKSAQRKRLTKLAMRTLAVGTLLALGACAQMDSAAPIDPAAAGAPSPNPYLAQSTRVPAAAREGMEHARGLYESGDVSGAERQLLTVTQTWPELSGPWLNLGIVQQRAGETEAAEQSMRAAIAANDNNVYAWNQLAALLRDGGRFEEAQQSYEAALQRWPDYGDAHRNLGILLDLYLHQPQAALAHYRAAQAVLEEPDRQLAGWIVELERRL